MTTTWPKNRGKPDLFEDLRDRQRLTLTCGVDGCRKRWTGEFGRIKAKRDTHRAEAHPSFKAPVRKIQGFGDKKRAAGATA